MQNNASTRQFFSSQPSEETKKMALPIILGNLNPIDSNLGSCQVLLQYGEHNIAINCPINFGFPIAFKLHYISGGITLGLKIWDFEFNWSYTQ